jgi:uncharacterized Zn finger protein (UPF0148 family)
MSWVKLDDGLDSHRKVEGTGLEALGLWTRALTYAARYSTNGAIDERWLRARVPNKRRRDLLVAELVDAGLLERLPAGEARAVTIVEREPRHGVHRAVEVGPFEHETLLIHDFLEYNESAAEGEARREKERERKAEQRREAERRRSVPAGHRAESVLSPSSPDPTRDPVRPNGSTGNSAPSDFSASNCARCGIPLDDHDADICSACEHQFVQLQERAV